MNARWIWMLSLNIWGTERRSGVRHRNGLTRRWIRWGMAAEPEQEKSWAKKFAEDFIAKHRELYEKIARE